MGRWRSKAKRKVKYRRSLPTAGEGRRERKEKKIGELGDSSESNRSEIHVWKGRQPLGKGGKKENRGNFSVETGLVVHGVVFIRIGWNLHSLWRKKVKTKRIDQKSRLQWRKGEKRK